ncbi:40S ribosomal protein S3, partial [Mycena capillaripes]
FNFNFQTASRAQVVADGVFRAELNDFFTRELTVEGYSGCDVRFTHARTETIIRATHTQEVLGEKGRRIRELTALVRKRFKFPKNSLELYVEKVQYRGLSAIAQCESLRYKLLGGLAVRRAYYGVLRFVMESGAKYCEVVVSGKLRAARAKSMKFTDNFMFHSGQIGRRKPLPDSVTIHEPPVDKTVSEPTSEQREPIANYAPASPQEYRQPEAYMGNP